MTTDDHAAPTTPLSPAAHLPRVGEVMDRLLEHYTRDEAVVWLAWPHPQLGGERPIDVIARGEVGRVRQILDRLDSGVYL